MARMVDISEKPLVKRQAISSGTLSLGPRSMQALEKDSLPKGNALATARVAAIQAVKETPRFLPLCHPIPITGIETEIILKDGHVLATVTVSTTYGTGVEMEALTGVSAALLCVWDMVKSLEKDPQGNYPETAIQDLKVISKIKEKDQ